MTTEADVAREGLAIFADLIDPVERARIEGELAREEAIQRAADAADPTWMDAARWAYYDVASRREEFTSDAVWALLEKRGVPMPKEPRAMGAVTRWASNSGWIEDTGKRVLSGRPENHRREIKVWRSKIVGLKVA